MAHLSPTTLTCPVCGFAARIEVVVGTGPASRKGDIPYRRFLEPGPFTVHMTEDGKKSGALLCPKDGTPVFTGQDGASMEGPLTEREIASGRRLNWVPPHMRPKPRKLPPTPSRSGPAKRSIRRPRPVQPLKPKRSS